MMKNNFEIGIVGLGAMGRNLLLNLRDHGHRGIGLDKDNAKVSLVKSEEQKSTEMDATEEVTVFLNQLQQPRVILLLIPAGAPVDSVLSELVPLLSPGDLVIDAGNSHFTETNLREKFLAEKGIEFFGMGVSGGEAGARNGPSIMPGGKKESYERVRPMLEAIAAQVNGEPCVGYLGPGSCGHYVKMVHNGIEYGLMQLIAEIYALMKLVLRSSNDECHSVFSAWNGSELSSYLLEITAQLFQKRDDTKSDGWLLDSVLDVAKQNGTGIWTSQDALKNQIPVPSIDAAVTARDLSVFKAERTQASTLLESPAVIDVADREAFVNQLRNAYHASSILIFAQSLVLLQKASVTYGYSLNLEQIARVWRGGCIIRTALLEPIANAYRQAPTLSNLLLDAYFARAMNQRQSDLRTVIQRAAEGGIPVPVMMAGLAYYDGYRSAWSPANLIQAQRDYFGAHRYERTDVSGTFHSDWGNS